VSAPSAQVLPCVQRPVDGRDHDALIATNTTNPPSSAAAPWDATAGGDGAPAMLVHRIPPSNSPRRVPRGTRSEMPTVQMKNLVDP
jgi:hypothetical protein